MKQFIICSFLIVLVTACGKNSSKKTSSSKSITPGGQQQETQLATGTYRAIIRPLNTSVHGMITSGVLKVKVDERNLKVNVIMDDAPKVTHLQGIYSGTTCPYLSADTKGDGIIDVNEEKRVSKKLIVPLDNDLSNPETNFGQYPSGDSYTYNKSTSYRDLMNDLYLTELLSGHEALNLEGKTIIVRGAPTTTKLPETVSSEDSLPKNITLAIACGVIERIEDESVIEL